MNPMHVFLFLFAAISAEAAAPPLEVLEENQEITPIKRAVKNEARELEYKYQTRQAVVLKGIVQIGDDEESALTGGLQEIELEAYTDIQILARYENEFGQKLARVKISTGDGDFVDVWVAEQELAASLYSVPAEKRTAMLSLDDMDARDALITSTDHVSVADGQGGGFILPVRGARKTSPPGMRLHPILKRWKYHAGWDYAAPTGTPVYATASGTVSFAGRAGGYGNMIQLSHGRVTTRYAHLSVILVRKGQSVSQGQTIGKVGSTGLSTGPHLHYEQHGGGAPAPRNRQLQRRRR